MGRYDILLGQDEKKGSADSTQRPTHTKGLDANAVQSDLVKSSKKRELTGSAFFQPQPNKKDREQPEPVRPVLPVRGTNSIKRVMKSRHPFDIYQDQYESLRELALSDRMQGGEGSMSAMVREALDAFIQKRTAK
jgi:hypothetical protein